MILCKSIERNWIDFSADQLSRLDISAVCAQKTAHTDGIDVVLYVDQIENKPRFCPTTPYGQHAPPEVNFKYIWVSKVLSRVYGKTYGMGQLPILRSFRYILAQ